MNKAIHAKSGMVLIDRIEAAIRLPERLKGLLGRKDLPKGSAMHIHACSSIHTFCMQFALDLIFLDSDSRVVKVIRHLKPYRIAFGGLKADSVMEMQSGWCDLEKIKKGDEIIITTASSQ